MTSRTTAPRALAPPEQLIDRFCKMPEHRVKGGARYDGDDRFSFDDGYSFMEYLTGCGWQPLHDKGDWPMRVYLRWPARDGTSPAIVAYEEGAFTLWCFDSPGDAKAHYLTLPDLP